MLDYIPFTKSQEEEIPVVGSTGGKNQKYTLKFLQNKQNYEKINKVKDYQSLLNSPEQITTRSLDLQQYELYLRSSNVKSKPQQIVKNKKEQKQLQLYKVESINLSEGAEHFKKLEMALNKSKFNKVTGSMSQQLVIKKMTRYQQQMEEQQQAQSLEIQPTPEESISIVQDLPNETIVFENQRSEQQESQSQLEEQEQVQEINEKENESVIAISLHSGNQQYSINNEISLLIHDDDDVANQDDLYEEQEKVESPKQPKQQKQKRQKAPKSEKKQQLQQQLQKINQSMNSQKGNQSVQSVVNQSMQSAKISNATKSNKISRQQSQVSLSDLDRIEQIISENANDLDQAEEMQRQKMRQHLRDLEEKIQKTKDRQEQFVYQPEDYQDMSGEYLKARKQEQQPQQQQQLQQPQQQQQQQPTPQQNTPAKKQTKQEVKPQQPIRPAKQQQRKPEFKNNTQQQQVQEQSIEIPQLTGQEEVPILSKKQSQHSIKVEKSVILSLKELDDHVSEKLPLGSDPLIKIENKLKQMEQDAFLQDNSNNEITFADYLLTAANVFDASYDKYKIYKKELKVEEPPSHFADEEKTLFTKMKLWDAQNKGNSHVIQGVAEIIRGIQTRFTSDANISDNPHEQQTQKTIDSDWD